MCSVCKAIMPHNTVTSRVMPCCSAMFSDACLTDFLNKYSWWCPYCGAETTTNNASLLRDEDDIWEIGSNIINEQAEERPNNAMRKQSVQKKRKL